MEDRDIGWLRSERLSDDEHRHALAHELGVPFVQLGHGDIAVEALVLIPEPLAREHNLVGYRLVDRDLEVALLDMDDLEQLGFLRSHYRVLPRLTSRDSLREGLRYYQRHLYQTYGSALAREDSPALLDTLLRHALAGQASDVHLQQTDGGLLVRYRIDGALKDAMTLSPAAGKTVLAKLRSLAGLPAGMLPREARVRVDLGSGEDVVLKVATVPTLAGDKMVLHLVREQARRGYTLESLGFHGESLEALHKMLLQRRGLITVEGLVGTGKSTLCYTLLDLLNSPEHSLATVEASVAHVFHRVAQTDLALAGLSMPAALRAALRTDPNVVMVDCITDRDSAAVAAAAAKRGVLVIAAVEDAALLPDADLAIKTAVVRKLCDKHFLDTRKLTRAQSDALESSPSGGAQFARVLAALKDEGKVDKETPWKDLQFPRAGACSECVDGYNGVVGLQEVRQRGEVVGLTLVEDGLFKALQGLTSIEEVQNLL